MDWPRTPRIFWLVLVLAIILTLYLSIVGFIKLGSPILELILIIEATLASEMVFYKVTRKLETADIKINAQINGNEFRIQVQSMNKTLRDARVYCNGIWYPWKYESGLELKRDILVGEEPPAFFVPFQVSMEAVAEPKTLNEQPEGTQMLMLEPQEQALKSAILIIMTEMTTKKEVTRLIIVTPYEMPEGSCDLSGIDKFFEGPKLSIRIVAEGIEEVKDYDRELRLRRLALFRDKNEKRIGILQFELKEKRRWLGF